MAEKELKTKGLTQAELKEHARHGCVKTAYKKGKPLPKIDPKDDNEALRYEAGDLARVTRYVDGKLYTFEGA